MQAVSLYFAESFTNSLPLLRKEQPEAGHEGFSGVRVAWYFMCFILHFAFAPIVKNSLYDGRLCAVEGESIHSLEQPEAGYERFSGIGMS